MRRTFITELKELQNDVLKMGSLVEDSVNKAVRALASANLELVNEVINNETKIDDYNLSIEEKSTQLIATQCPVARDLRLIHSILYVSIHLERAGDLALNVADMTAKIKDAPISDFVMNIEEMGAQASRIIRLSLEAFANKDVKLAHKLPKLDEPIDEAFKNFFRQLVKYAGNEELIDAASNVILAARYIERIADHAVDIGQRVSYLVTGQIEELE